MPMPFPNRVAAIGSADSTVHVDDAGQFWQNTCDASYDWWGKQVKHYYPDNPRVGQRGLVVSGKSRLTKKELQTDIMGDGSLHSHRDSLTEGLAFGRLMGLAYAEYPRANGTAELPWPSDERNPLTVPSNPTAWGYSNRWSRWGILAHGATDADGGFGFGGYAGGRHSKIGGESVGECARSDDRLLAWLKRQPSSRWQYVLASDPLLAAGIDNAGHHEFGHEWDVNSHDASKDASGSETIAQIAQRIAREDGVIWPLLNIMISNRWEPLAYDMEFIDPRDGRPFIVPAGKSLAQWCDESDPDPLKRVSFNALIWWPENTSGQGNMGNAVNPQRYGQYTPPAGARVYYPLDLSLTIPVGGIPKWWVDAYLSSNADWLVPYLGSPTPTPIPTPIPTPVPAPVCPFVVQNSQRMTVETITLKQGASYQLIADKCGENISEPAGWFSLNTNVASVSETADVSTDGIVRARKLNRWSLGAETKIRVIYQGTTKEVTVRVRRF